MSNTYFRTTDEKVGFFFGAGVIYFICGYLTAFILDVMVNVVDGWEVAAAGIFWPLFWIKYLGWGVYLLLEGLITALF